MRAVITHEVELRFGSVDDQDDEPLMRLETGEEVTAYHVDRYIALGTEGEATYDDKRGVWIFVPDEESDGDSLKAS